MKKKLKCNWLLFSWKAPISYGGRERFRTKVSVVIFFLVVRIQISDKEAILSIRVFS
jgi:hypothetical protein